VMSLPLLELNLNYIKYGQTIDCTAIM